MRSKESTFPRSQTLILLGFSAVVQEVACRTRDLFPSARITWAIDSLPGTFDQSLVALAKQEYLIGLIYSGIAYFSWLWCCSPATSSYQDGKMAGLGRLNSKSSFLHLSLTGSDRRSELSGPNLCISKINHLYESTSGISAPTPYSYIQPHT